MTTRINFLEKKRFQITYQVMGTAIGGVLLVCGLLYGILWLNTVRVENRLKGLQADIERLRVERERIISQDAVLMGQGAFAQIQQAIEKTPAWSNILNALTQALPPRTWLASIKSADVADTPFQKEIVLNGQAKNAQAITAFLANLQADPHFKKVVLTTSAEEANGLFQFSITCDIGPKKWTLKP